MSDTDESPPSWWNCRTGSIYRASPTFGVNLGSWTGLLLNAVLTIDQIQRLGWLDLPLCVALRQHPKLGSPLLWEYEHQNLFSCTTESSILPPFSISPSLPPSRHPTGNIVIGVSCYVEVHVPCPERRRRPACRRTYSILPLSRVPRAARAQPRSFQLVVAWISCKEACLCRRCRRGHIFRLGQRSGLFPATGTRQKRCRGGAAWVLQERRDPILHYRGAEAQTLTLNRNHPDVHEPKVLPGFKIGGVQS